MILWLLVAASAVSGLAADLRAEEDRRVFADGLFSRELYLQAANEYARLLNDFPAGADRDLLFFRLGESLRLSGDRASAARAFLRVIQIDGAPFRHRAMFKRAAIFLEIDQPETAVELFEALLKEDPAADVREMTLYYLGDAQMRVGREADACKTFEAMISAYPDGEIAVFAKLALGRLYSLPGESHQPARGRDLLESVVEGGASDRLVAEARYLMARASFSNERYKEAAEAFRLLELHHPDDLRVAESGLQAAWAYLHAGFYDNALSRCARALAESATLAESDRAAYRYIRASAAFQLLRYEEAMGLYAETAERHPNSTYAAKAWYQAALSAHRLERHDETIRVLQRILSDPELRENALWLMSEAASARNDADLAVQYYRLLIAEYPQSRYSPDAHYRLGHQLQLRRSWMEASAFFLQLVERHPDSDLAPKALFASATSLSSAGQSARALRDWEAFLTRYPNDPGVVEALYQKALDEIRVDRKAAALDTLDYFLTRFPDSRRLPDVQFWRGQLLREKGSLKDAERALRVVLASNPGDDMLRETRFSLAMVLQQDGREGEAAAIFQELIDDPIRAKFTPQQFAWLSEHQYDEGAFQTAAQTARILVTQTDDSGWQQAAWTLAGRALVAARQPGEAETAFRNALAIDFPSRHLAEATLSLAGLVLAKGDHREADQLYALAVRRCAAPDLQDMRIHAYVGLGRAALAAGRQEDAVRYLMTVSLLYHNDQILPGVLAETAALLDSLGRVDEALTLRRELIETYPQSTEADEAATHLEGVN